MKRMQRIPALIPKWTSDNGTMKRFDQQYGEPREHDLNATMTSAGESQIKSL